MYAYLRDITRCPAPYEHILACEAANAIVADCMHAGIMHDPRVRWYGKPKAKHGKILPRWSNFGQETNGNQHKRPLTALEMLRRIAEGETDTNRANHEFDYASTSLIWE